MRIKAVVFDLFITLTDFEAERCRPQFMDELATAIGAEPVAFASLMRSTFTERVTGRLGDAPSTFATLAHRLGCDLSPQELDRVMAMRYQQQQRSLTPRPGVLEAISDLRTAGYAIGILTDCTAETPDTWPSLPYAAVTDAVTFSCHVGHRKPHPASYQDISGKLGVAAAECVYVGDGSSAELTGAASAGMTAVLIQTPFGTDFRYDAESDWAGRSIADIDELRPLLRELQA